VAVATMPPPKSKIAGRLTSSEGDVDRELGIFRERFGDAALSRLRNPETAIGRAKRNEHTFGE
jgi:hypothetical protein